MSDKPTYREYRLSCRAGNVVKTRDGRYFLMKYRAADSPERFYEPHSWPYTVLGVICVAAPMVLDFYFNFWPSLRFDALLYYNLLLLLLPVIRYRFARFELIDNETRDRLDIPSWLCPPIARSVFLKKLKAVWYIFLVLLFLNTFSFFCLRSLFGSPSITAAEYSFHTSVTDIAQPLDINSDHPVISVPGQSAGSNIDVQITVSGSPSTATLRLDGNPVSDSWSAHKEYSWFWEKHIFVQTLDKYVSGIHDGSTLTLTCGDLRREWTFEVADSKEGL